MRSQFDASKVSKQLFVGLLLVLGLFAFAIPGLAASDDGGKGGGECRAHTCGVDLIIDYYYDDDCNMFIVITNIGTEEVTIGGSNNINVVGINGTSVIGMGATPVTLAPGESHEIWVPPHVAENFEWLTVDPNNDIAETNEENNTVDVVPCKQEPTCAASVRILDLVQSGADILVTFEWETIGVTLVEATITLFDDDNNVVGTFPVGALTPPAGGTMDFPLTDLDIPSGLYRVRINLTTDCIVSAQDERFIVYEVVDPEPIRICHAAVDPYLGSYANGKLKAEMCLEVDVNGSQAVLTAYGENEGLAPIGPAPADTVTTLVCRVRQNGAFVTGQIDFAFATWDLQMDLNATVSHTAGDSYELTCEHEWVVDSTDFYLFSEPAPITITP